MCECVHGISQIWHFNVFLHLLFKYWFLGPFVIGTGKEFHIFIDPFSLVRFRKLVFGWSSVLTDYINMMVFCIVKPCILKTEVQLSLCPHLVTILDSSACCWCWYRMDIGEPGVPPCSEPAGACLHIVNHSHPYYLTVVQLWPNNIVSYYFSQFWFWGISCIALPLPMPYCTHVD